MDEKDAAEATVEHAEPAAAELSEEELTGIAGGSLIEPALHANEE